MEYRVAINGFGRIGRNYVRCLLERGLLGGDVRVVAINDLWDPGTLAYLLQNDPTLGTLRGDVAHDEANIRVDGHTIPTFREKDPVRLPWGDLDVPLVIESTGRLRARDDAAMHLKAGARRVLISA